MLINILMGILTLMALILVSFVLSSSRNNIKWKTVLVGLVGQFVIIFFALKVPIGQFILSKLAFGVQGIINFSSEGLKFVFGDLTGMSVFFVNVLAVIIFTSALISVLYFLKIIPFFINKVGTLLSKVLGCSKVETMSAVANSFLGGNEASLVIKPYIPKLTKSEFFCCMAGGFSSASAGIIAGYSSMPGIQMKYLLLAVFTVPFACLMFAKILEPETEISELQEVEIMRSEDKNIFEAISSGAQSGMQIAIGVAASLVAFVAMVALLNGFLGLFHLSLSQIMGWVFAPVAWLLHIPHSEIATFSSLLGTKTSVNEFVAYTQLSGVIPHLSARTIAISTVVLCNFCNFSVIAIQTAGMKALCPERASEMAQIGLKTLLCGLLATLSTGAIVGMLLI